MDENLNTNKASKLLSAAVLGVEAYMVEVVSNNRLSIEKLSV